MKRIAIFASGSGSNAANIVRYFRDNSAIEIAAIFTNNQNAGVVKVGEQNGVPVHVFGKNTLYNSTDILDLLRNEQIDFIVLAGFLLLVPEYLIKAYPGRIINIHPALLPRYGGKGMYGEAVHKAVLDNNEHRTGITIHYVNRDYDDGRIIAQYECEIDPEKDTVSSVKARVRELEHTYYPKVIAELVEAL